MKWKPGVLLAIFLLLGLCACSEQRTVGSEASGFELFEGPYCGQQRPVGRPEILLPGLLTTRDLEGCAAFLDDGKVLVFSSWERGTLYTFEDQGSWRVPLPAPWQNDRGVTDFTAGPDGRTVFFQSARPTDPEDDERETNTWYARWTGSGWTDPTSLPEPANMPDRWEGYPSVAADGTVVFFSIAEERSRAGEIFVSTLVDGEYLEAEALPDPINSEYHEVDPLVAPDGSYLLFGSGRPGGYQLGDLYVSFRAADGSWGPPVNAGPGFNNIGEPIRMNLTTDGSTLLFPSDQTTTADKGPPVDSPMAQKYGDADVYWMDTGFIEELRTSLWNRTSAAAAFVAEYRTRGLRPAIDALQRTLVEDDGYLELSDLMMFCASLVSEGRTEEAGDLYRALLAAMPEDAFRIRQGFAVGCILDGALETGIEHLRELWADHPETRSEPKLGLLTYQLSLRGRSPDELGFLRFITSEFPDSDLAQVGLATAFERRQQIPEALACGERALEINPDCTDAKELLERLRGSAAAD